MGARVPGTPRAPLLAVALISGTALAHEILLMRLYAIIQWHHFAYMIISLALLGFGASGTVLALAGKRLVARYRLVAGLCAGAFAVACVVCFVASQHVPFNALELAWDPAQAAWLAAIYVLLMPRAACSRPSHSCPGPRSPTRSCSSGSCPSDSGITLPT